VDERQNEQPVGSGPDTDPFVRDRRIAAAHRVDRHDLRASRLERSETAFHRIRGVVLGDAEQQQIFRALPVRLAEFPERAANGVEAGRRHVDGAESTVGGEIRRAELGRPPAGERLALVAAGEEGELAGVLSADLAEPLCRDRQRLVPLDLDEFAPASLADSFQRLSEPRRRDLLHDAGRALGAEDAIVDRMIRIALDMRHVPVANRYRNAASTGAHVAGRVFDRFVCPRGE